MDGASAGLSPELEQARKRVQEAIALAARPSAQSLGQVAPALQEAAAALRQAGVATATRRPPATTLLYSELRRDLRLLRALLEQAAAIVGGWAKARACLSCGYSPAGDAAAVDAVPSIVVRG